MTTATTIHVPAGEGTSYAMIDGDHVVKAAVQDAEGAFEVFEVVATARPMAPPSNVTSTSIVGFPRESRISRARTAAIFTSSSNGWGKAPADLPRPPGGGPPRSTCQ